MKLLLRSHSMGIAALALGLGVLLSRLLGLVRDKIISYYFGAGIEADLYFTAFVVPDFLNYLLAGGYFSVTLVPLLSRYFIEDEADGWRFFSSAVTWAFTAIALLTGVAFIFAPEIIAAIAPKYTPQAQERLVRFLRIILPAQVCFLPGACFSAVLYLRKQFSIPAISPLIYNGSIIILGWLSLFLFPDKGIEGFCWGVTIGAALGSLALPVFAVKSGGMSFFPCFKHIGMKRVLLLALPLMLGQSIVALDEQFIRIFGGLTGEGGVSLLSYSRRIMQVPVGVIAQAAGLASYPFLAGLLAEGKTEDFNRRLNNALLATILVALPVSLWMMVAAEPIMRLIFQQGSFVATDAASAGALLSIMMAAVVFWSLQQVLGRGFYAHQDMVSPAVMGSVATVLVLPLYWGGAVYFGVTGVAVASSVGVLFYAGLLLSRWRKKYGGSALWGIGGKTFKAFVLCLPACLLAGFAAWGTGMLFPEASLWGAFFRILTSGLAFLVGYFLVMFRVAPDLCAPFTVFLSKIRDKLGR